MGKKVLRKYVSFKQIVLLLLSDVGYALALNLFYVHNNIAAGGLAGIGTIINSFAPIPVGALVFIMNIPILIWAIFVKGKTYTLMTFVASAVYSLIVDLLSFLPSLTDDMLTAVVCGGILYGASAACSIKARISIGGTDLLAKMLITKFKSMSYGKLLMIIDGTVVLLSVLVYGNIEPGIYAILAIAVCSVVSDRLNSGFNKANAFFIFANTNSDMIVDRILSEVNRGVTGIPAIGKYGNSEREILMVVVKPSEAPHIKSLVHQCDPSAFIVQVHATEIIGEGFENLQLTDSLLDK